MLNYETQPAALPDYRAQFISTINCETQPGQDAQLRVPLNQGQVQNQHVAQSNNEAKNSTIWPDNAVTTQSETNLSAARGLSIKLSEHNHQLPTPTGFN